MTEHQHEDVKPRDDEPRQIATRTSSSRLTEQQLAAIDHLVLGKTVTETAEAIGVHRATVSLWVNQNAGFGAMLRHRRAETWEATRSRLEGLGGKAVDVLGKLLDDASPRVRLMASKAVLGALVPARPALGASEYGEQSPPLAPVGAYTGAAEGVLMPPENLSAGERETIRNLLHELRGAAWKARDATKNGTASDGAGPHPVVEGGPG